MAYLIVVAAALINADGKVLVQQCPPGHGYAGMWEFPGGKIDDGESAVQALSRELAEELNIAADPADFEPVGFATSESGARPILLALYANRARWRGTPQPLHAAALQWLDIGALAALAASPGKMPPADIPLVRSLNLFLRG